MRCRRPLCAATVSHSHGWLSLPLLPAPFCKYAAAAEQRYRVLVGHDSIEHDGQTLTGPRALLSRWKLLDQVPADALGGLPSPLWHRGCMAPCVTVGCCCRPAHTNVSRRPPRTADCCRDYAPPIRRRCWHAGDPESARGAACRCDCGRRCWVSLTRRQPWRRSWRGGWSRSWRRSW